MTHVNLACSATVSDFSLDIYEITVERFRAFVSAGYGTQQKPPEHGSGANPNLPESGWQGGWNMSLAANTEDLKSGISCTPSYRTWTDSPSGNENRPINCITWYEAFAFCIWDGGRLPTEVEWNYAAAGGSEQRQYSWGSTDPGNNTNFSIHDCLFNGTNSCDGVVDIAPVGSAPAGIGKWGQADLSGNMWEWVLDYFGQCSTSCNNCANLTSASTRISRGGSFHDNNTVVLSSSYRGFHGPTDRLYGFGGRCARTP